jgi:hypothetical protein
MKKRFIFTLMLLFVFASKVLCQDVSFPEINTLTPDNLFDATVEPLFALVVILSGYLSAFIPGIKKLTPFYRVLAFAIAAGLGFYLFGFASFWKIVTSYFFASGLYITFLKNIFRSPAAALPAG